MIGAQTSRGKKVLIPRGWMNAAGQLRTFARVRVRDADGNKDIWDVSTGPTGLLVTVTPSSVQGFAATPSEITVTSSVVTAAIAGAVGNVSWTWTRTVGASGWVIGTPQQPQTTFSIDLSPGEIEIATFRVTATDALGRTATADVNVTCSNLGGFL